MTHRPRQIAGVAAALLALATTCLAGVPATATEAPITKTLVIGIDGATFATLDAVNTPRLDALRAQGTTSTSNLYASPMAGTWSGPGWSSIATGVWPDKHGVTENNFSPAHFDAYPDYLSRINHAIPARNTAALGTWEAISANIFGPGVDQRSGFATDAATTAAAVLAISGGTDDLFVHLDDVDHAGHEAGTSSPGYGAALASTDVKIGQILDAVAARPTTESWTIVATTDHGHTASGGHGGSSAPERQVFMVVAAPGVAANATRHDAKPVDIAPTMMAAAGVPLKPEWHLDGTPFGALTSDAFDTLRPSLAGRVDETQIPAATRGWTSTAPNGWSIDNAAMPMGGVTEWRGWSFVSDEFWTAADPNQGRETSVRARDVFAVADSDEWDDKTHATGQFDSTLVSPNYPVSGLIRASLSFATNYKIDGPQSAAVAVTFNTGQTQILKSYSAETNTVENLPFTVPAGATTAQFRFRYTGENSSFWMVDAVGIKDAIEIANIRYAVNASGLSSPEWVSLAAAAGPGGLMNSVSEQSWGIDPATQKSWGYLGANSAPSGNAGGDMFSTLRYATNGADLVYRFGGLAPGKYTVHAGYSEPWPWGGDRGAKVTINGEIRESDHPYITENTMEMYGDVVVGADNELTFLLARSRSADVQLSWLIVSSVPVVAPPATAPWAVAASARCMGGKATLAVSVRNTGTVPMDIQVSTRYGSKAFTAVTPGKSATASFNSRLAQIPEGAVTVAGTPAGGPAVTSTTPYTGLSCQ